MIFYPFFGNLTTNISITFMVNEQEPASALPMTVGMYGDVGEWSPPFLAYYLYVPIPNGGRLCPPHSFVPTKIFDIPAYACLISLSLPIFLTFRRPCYRMWRARLKHDKEVQQTLKTPFCFIPRHNGFKFFVKSLNFLLYLCTVGIQEFPFVFQELPQILLNFPF